MTTVRWMMVMVMVMVLVLMVVTVLDDGDGRLDDGDDVDGGDDFC